MDHLLTLQPAASEPMHSQLEQRVREDVRAGRLRPGTRLPSTRSLAAELGVSRGVVVEAYAQLTAEGYLDARAGAATRVAGGAPEEGGRNGGGGGVGERGGERGTKVLSGGRTSTLPAIAYDLHPGTPDLASFPRAEWMACLRRVLRDAPDAALGYGSPRGPRVLRDELAIHLGRSRGVVADPRHMVICAGLSQGFGVIFRTLRAQGVRRVALEDPGWFGARLALHHEGLEAIAVPVDDDGLRVDLLARTDAQAVVVTPAHQSPLGAVLSPPRRAALLAWARERDALIIEDDYDAEHRFDRGPVGALQGLAPEHVLFAGSASKVLAPGLRIGWLLVPPSLSRPLAMEKTYADGGSAVLDQLVLAELLRRGGLDRHLRRTRRRLRVRRDALVDALARRLPEAEVHGVAAGLHAVVIVPDDVDEATWIAGARARGVVVYGMAATRMTPGPPGLVLGYANLPEPALERAVGMLADAYGEAVSGGRSGSGAGGAVRG